MAQFEEGYRRLDQLLLDPNNYRYQDSDDYVTAEESRFHEESVQAKAFSRLYDESLKQLKNSILKNGFIPVERIVVRSYAHRADTYVVVEGNRRVAALRWIKRDHDAGLEVSQHVLEVLDKIPVVVLGDELEDPAFAEALMGVRHVSGIKEWGGYQRAKLIATLKDERTLDSNEIADRLGMSTNEVNRRYRAYRALKQMQDDDGFGEYCHPDLYPLFHEAVSIPKVREWLDWNEETPQFDNVDQLLNFYELITPNNPEEAVSANPKIATYAHVRELRHILANRDATRALLDPDRSLAEAIAISKKDEYARAWRTLIADALGALDSMGVKELKGLDTEDLEQVEKLKNAAIELLENHQKLIS